MIVRNKILPPKGFKAIAIFPFIFINKKVNDIDINHEKIHFAQQKELLIIFFYLLYGMFHLIYGYENNPFEKEAYNNEKDIEYLKTRKHYSYFKYLKKNDNKL